MDRWEQDRQDRQRWRSSMVWIVMLVVVAALIAVAVTSHGPGQENKDPEYICSQYGCP